MSLKHVRLSVLQVRASAIALAITLATAIVTLALPAFETHVEAQDHGTVKVTVARANIRAEASETSKVLAQVTQGMELDLVAVEGDWFHVRVPVSGLRIEAYISKKVAKIATPPPAPSAVARGGSPSAAAPAPSAADRSGMSVVMTTGPNSVPLTGHTLHVVQVGDKIDSLTKAAAIVPATGAPAGQGADSAVATFVWVADGSASSVVISDRKPSFLGLFKDLVGLSPDDLMPVLVRVTPAASGIRLVAALRGRADQATRTDADWDVVKDLKQDLIKTETQRVERGGVRVTPIAPLDPGEYAIVFRLAAKKKLAGSILLGPEGEGKVFALAWDFSVK